MKESAAVYRDSMDTPYVKRWIIEGAERIDREIAAKNVEPQQWQGHEAPDVHYRQRTLSQKEVAYAHLRWMCQKIKQLALEEEFGECRSHLDFMTGAMWMLGHDMPDRFQQ